MTSRRIVAEPFYTVEEAAAFYVAHGGHGIITHTVRGTFDQHPSERRNDPAWLVEVFVPYTQADVEEHNRLHRPELKDEIGPDGRIDEEAVIARMMAHGAPSEEEAREAWSFIAASFNPDDIKRSTSSDNDKSTGTFHLDSSPLDGGDTTS